MLELAQISQIQRPHKNLFTYYCLSSLLLGPLFLIALIPLYFRYHTMRYRFDDEGISMSWGILFHREISLTYSRIQDIHLSSNLFERWMNLARIQIQTASGSSNAEMTIEGLLEFEQIRDFLYSRMRGARHAAPHVAAPAPSADLAALLDAVAEELRGIRSDLERGRGDVV